MPEQLARALPAVVGERLAGEPLVSIADRGRPARAMVSMAGRIAEEVPAGR